LFQIITRLRRNPKRRLSFSVKNFTQPINEMSKIRQMPSLQAAVPAVTPLTRGRRAQTFENFGTTRMSAP
jgi:hypothetical protein